MITQRIILSYLLCLLIISSSPALCLCWRRVRALRSLAVMLAWHRVSLSSHHCPSSSRSCTTTNQKSIIDNQPIRRENFRGSTNQKKELKLLDQSEESIVVSTNQMSITDYWPASIGRTRESPPAGAASSSPGSAETWSGPPGQSSWSGSSSAGSGWGLDCWWRCCFV